MMSMGANFGDLDNDGWLDFFSGAGNPNFDTLAGARMFRNDGRGRFQDVTTFGGFGQLQKGHRSEIVDKQRGLSGRLFRGRGCMQCRPLPQPAIHQPGNRDHWLKLDSRDRLEPLCHGGPGRRVRVGKEGGFRDIYRTVGGGAEESSGLRRCARKSASGRPWRLNRSKSLGLDGEDPGSGRT